MACGLRPGQGCPSDRRGLLSVPVPTSPDWVLQPTPFARGCDCLDPVDIGFVAPGRGVWGGEGESGPKQSRKGERTFHVQETFPGSMPPAGRGCLQGQ